MSDTRSRQLKALFAEAVTLPVEQRDAFLRAHRNDDPDLITELEELLEADTRFDAIGDAVSAVADSLLDHDGEPSVSEGRRIGAYRVIDELGRGGMGRVHLAERDDDQYSGRVAIKMLAPGTAGTVGGERFRNESQALADLRHPNIAQLLDAGATEQGEPYLVIEYVEGESIDVYCDSRKLSLDQRTTLFIALCEAVEHAHRNLVVHRDIKASNVLVTADGEPKLLDFGIAKLLDLERAETLDLHLTGDASRLLTPATASPEQLRGEPVTTATDVYQLGHLLYRLLTGSMPYAVESRDRVALPAAILNEEPKRPSQAARSFQQSATNRGTTPDRMVRQLSGDLDAIVLKALRKTPEERYAGARELAEDLERHLEHRPVHARGEALGYVTRRFIARNRTALAAAATVIVLIAALVSFYTTQLAAERDRARIEARRSEEVATFITDLFEVATPEESRGAQVTAREMLDRGAERIGAELRGEPAVQASLMGVIGTAYGKLGLYETSTEVLETALATKEALGGEEDAVLGDALHDLGAVLLAQARYDEARALLERALDVRRRVLGAMHADIADTLRAQASLEFELANYDAVAARLDEAENVARALQPTSPLPLAAVLLDRGYLADKLGNYDAAIDDTSRAIAMRSEVFGADHPDTLQARNTLAQTLNNAGRRGEAENTLRDILEIRRRVLPPGHTDIARGLTELSASLKLQGRPEEAEPLQAEALEIYRDAYPDDHPQVAVALNNLANLRHDLRDLDAALELHEASLAMHRRLYGDEHPSLADSYNNIAALLMDRHEYTDALRFFRQTLVLDSNTLGEDHPYIGFDRLAIGVALGVLGDTEEAEPTLRQALDEIRRVSGNEHPQTFNARRELGIFLQRQDRCDEAEPLLADALPGLERSFPGNPWQVATAWSFLGACRAADDPAEGEALMRRAFERLLETQGADHRLTLQARDNLTVFLRSIGREAEAAALQQETAMPE